MIRGAAHCPGRGAVWHPPARDTGQCTGHANTPPLPGSLQHWPPLGWPSLHFKACQMFNPPENSVIIWLGRVQMGWCGYCNLSKLACKHVLTEENCRAMLKSSSWVGFTVLGNAFKCSHTGWEGGSTIINSQRSALASREKACLEPLSLCDEEATCSGKGHIFWVQGHQTNITSAFCLSPDMITAPQETWCLSLWSNLERIKAYFPELPWNSPSLPQWPWLEEAYTQFSVRYGVHP